MKAPNGQPTLLSEKQWLLVRTENFKKWFGDWEKKSRIEKPLNSETLVLKWDAESPVYDLNASSAESFIHREYQGKVFENDDTEEKYVLSKKGRQKLLSHGRYNEVHLKSLFFLPQIIKHSAFITETDSYKENGKYDRYRYFVCGINLDGTDYTVKSVFGLDSNGVWVYDQGLSQIEKGALIGMLTKHVTQDSLQVKDTTLLSILQDDYSKVLDRNGEPMLMYHGSPTEGITVFNGEDYKERNGGSKSLIFFSPHRNIAEQYAGNGSNNTYTCFMNMRNPIDTDALKDRNNVFYQKYGEFLEEYYRRQFTEYANENPSIKEEDINKSVKERVELYNDDVYKQVLEDKPVRWNIKESFLENLQDYGYDGFIDRHVFKDSEYAVLKSNQIKSATDNNGDFSIDNPDIRYQDSLNTQPREGTCSNSDLIASSYRFDTDKGKYYITDGVQKEVFSVISATMPNATEEQLSDLRKTAVFATAFLTLSMENSGQACKKVFEAQQ